MSSARLGLLAIVLLVASYATLVQQVGCAQSAHLALTRELAAGHASIDELHWFTCDKSYSDGHFYAAKSPGIAFLSVPLYLVLDAAGVAWKDFPPSPSPDSLYTIEPSTVWPFTLWAVVLPALLLLLLVRRKADDVEPGYGTVTAVTLGAATLVLAYSTLYASHIPAALCAFGAFVLAARSRRETSVPLALAAGAAGGLAVVFDAPFGLAALLIGVYSAFAGRPVVRSAAYAAGAFAGAVPLLAFNWWAVGSPFRSSYEHVVINQGQTGHDSVGLADSGFFGITTPRWRDAIELLLAPKGLLVLAPVMAVAGAGLVLLWRRGRRADALLIAALAAGYLLYNAGFFAPFGGDSAGPRYLLPVVVFLSVPLAAAYRRWPLTTGALALVSVAWAIAATATLPMLGDQDTSQWLRRLWGADFTETLVTLLGGGNRWLSILPFVLLLASAAWIAVRVTPWPSLRPSDAQAAVVAVLGWAAVYAWSGRLADPTALELGAATIVAAAAIVATLFAYRPDWLRAPEHLEAPVRDR